MQPATQRSVSIRLAGLAVLTALGLGAAGGAWTVPPAVAAVAQERGDSATMTAEQLLPLTVSEAWEQSGGDYNRFSMMVRTLVAYSMDKRGLMLPNTREAGRAIGKTIRRRAEANRDQLLYAVVDGAVRTYAKNHRITAQRPEM